jgi:hypothetical protein
MKEFMVKVVQRSGLSQKGTYLPPAIHPQHTPEVREWWLASPAQGTTHKQALL